RAPERDQEREAGDARVAGEGGRGQESDPAGEDGAQARRGEALRARRAGRRQEGEGDGDAGRGEEGEPPVEGPQEATAQRRERHGGGLHGGEGPHGSPEPGAGCDVGEAGEEQWAEKRVRRPLRGTQREEGADR